MPLFGSKERCPACGSRKLTEQDSIWGCENCGASGSRFRGVMIYAGIHGNPRSGQFSLNDAVDPPVLTQLASIAPELRDAARDPSVAQAFNYGALNVLHHFDGTSFDIEDDDVNAAIATYASNVLGPDIRRDDNRFHLTTAASDWGWWWRYFEREDEVAPQDPEDWLKSLIPSGWQMSRSERLGNAAQNYVQEDDLPSTTIGYAEHGEAVIHASFLLLCATMNYDDWATRLGLDLSLLEQAHRFGLALRTVALADELAMPGDTDGEIRETELPHE